MPHWKSEWYWIWEQEVQPTAIWCLGLGLRGPTGIRTWCTEVSRIGSDRIWRGGILDLAAPSGGTSGFRGLTCICPVVLGRLTDWLEPRHGLWCIGHKTQKSGVNTDLLVNFSYLRVIVKQIVSRHRVITLGLNIAKFILNYTAKFKHIKLHIKF